MVEARILGEITADNETGGSLDDKVGLVAATSTQVRAIAVRAVAEAEPDQHQARHRRAFADRRLMLRGDLDVDGMGALTLHYDTLAVQAIYHRLGLVARNATSADDPRTLTQRVADLAAACSPATSPPSRRRPATWNKVSPRRSAAPVPGWARRYTSP